LRGSGGCCQQHRIAGANDNRATGEAACRFQKSIATRHEAMSLDCFDLLGLLLPYSRPQRSGTGEWVLILDTTKARTPIPAPLVGLLI
jgi:hypothetical protein